ncbi:MAG: substrate-binding domain-containing protein [Treponema sp.]|nr:substrate-binding domain-containing protein [Treponema sp.]
MRNVTAHKRIGFILASIHTGSSIGMWPRLAEDALQENGSLFIFPGGRLASASNADSQRNRIYSLVNPENLDGIISWASSIGGTISLDELTAFHESFESMPMVTIGQKIKHFPLVAFTAYDGMKDLVNHFITVHGSKRIAFLRGPTNHTSAEDRYRGYKEAMREAGLEQNIDILVSDNFAWSDGDKAIEQLCQKRKLVPGKDFDTLIAASDMMAFSAVSWLEKRGYQVPRDLMIGGFNDSVESRIATVPFSTVHMPYEQMGLAAYKMIKRVLLTNERPDDCSLSAYKVVRESCGCNSLKSWIATSGTPAHAKEKQQIIDDITEAFAPCSEETALRIRRLGDYLFSNKQTEFFSFLTTCLTDYFERSGDISRLFAAETILRNANSLSEATLERILRGVNIIIPQIQGKVAARKQYKESRTAAAVNALKGELLSVHDRKSLIHVLARALPGIGISSTTIILYENETFSKYAGSFTASGEIREDEMLFSSQLLIPAKYKSDFDKGAFIIQPLFMENQPLGYLICSYSNCSGLVYEDLRSAVSSTLQSIFLFEEAATAKEIAEQAEFAKTEFFANVGNDLCDPLKHISAKLTQMETNIEQGVVDSDILGEQLLFLKSQIDSQLEKTETLVDLTRTQVNDLPMNKVLFSVNQILPANSYILDKPFPLLFGDIMRLKNALQTILDFSAGIRRISDSYDGLHITIESQRLDWHKPELLLAEKIFLLQYGELKKTDRSVTIILPWPNLAGQPPLKLTHADPAIYSLSALSADRTIVNTKIQTLNEEAIEAVSESGEVALLYWNPDEAPINDWIKVKGLRHHEKLWRAPLLCFSSVLLGHTFGEILNQKVQEQTQTSVLFVGAKHTRYGTWATEENSVSIKSMEYFDSILREITPSLIVFEKIDEATIITIRQNVKTVMVPILVLPDAVSSVDDVELLCSHPRIILCNRGAAESEQFDSRIRAILDGDEILPPHTGALVKKAILYLNQNASQQIVRWKLADTVHVSEDYLTRIFHKELGLSLWEYLNRYRIYLATKLLLETNDTIYEIAEKSGFQDQAYFCRVFKKICGIPPGRLRIKQQS